MEKVSIPDASSITSNASSTHDEDGSIAAILTERGSRYGRFKDMADISQALKATMYNNITGLHQLAPDQREALEMIQHKISRIINGDPNYIDSWDDIAGYAKLVADRLRGVVR